MTDPIQIRRLEQGDLPALLEIYNHYVLNTPVTFDIEPRTLDQRQAWFEGFGSSGRYQCFVAVKGGRPVGWASSHRYHERAAYDATVMSSIYLAPDACGQGLGKRLYATLFDALARRGYPPDVRRHQPAQRGLGPAASGIRLRTGGHLPGSGPEIRPVLGRGSLSEADDGPEP